MLLCAHQQKDKHLSMLKMFLKEFFFQCMVIKQHGGIQINLEEKKYRGPLREDEQFHYLVNI